MSKKLLVVVMLVLVSTLLVGGSAFAAEENSPTFHPRIISRGRLNFGEITELSSDEFVIIARGGGSYTYLVDEKTLYRMKDVESPTFADLALGQYVLVGATMVEGELIASVVGITPEGFNPARWFGIRVRGKVVNVDLDEGTVTIRKPSGAEISFLVGERTRFIGEASTIEDLEIGWEIGVAVGEKDDGTNFASILAASERRRRVKHVGTITGLDEADGTMSILTQGGEEKVIGIDIGTKFHSRKGEIEDFSDLQLEMVVIVAAVLQEDGKFNATHVAAANKEDLPNYDIKVGGKVTEINANGLTIETKKGEELSFSVISETTFRSRGVDVQGLDDLKLGMKVNIGAEELDSGELLAQLVITLKVFNP